MSFKPILLKTHRYAALILSPILLLIILSGAVLSFKPILAPEVGGALASQNLTTLSTIIAAQAEEPSAVRFSMDGQKIYLEFKKNNTQVFDATTGQNMGEAGMSNAVFQWFKSLHKSLLVGLGDVVEWVTYAFLAFMIIGFALLMKPRSPKTLMGAHNTLAWVFLPLVLLLPVTAILMELKVGAPNFKRNYQDAQIVSMTDLIDVVKDHSSMGQLQAIESKKGRFQTIYLQQNNAIQSYKYSQDNTLNPIQAPSYLPKALHEGTWANQYSGYLNLAITLLLVFFVFSGCYSWLRRTLQNRQAMQTANHQDVNLADIIVAYASQTGTASKLAHATAQSLQQANINAKAIPLSAIKPDQLSAQQLLLMVVSTTGDGDYPDQAQPFVKALANTSLAHVNYSLLALGDRQYTHFCQAGIRLNDLMQQAHANAVLDIHCVDGDVNQPWQNWLALVAQHLGVTLDNNNDIANDLPISLTLTSKTLLSAEQENIKPVWQLSFAVMTPDVRFRPGDLLLITPPNSTQARCYSIGSSSLVGQTIQLTVGLEKNDSTETGFGICSHYLDTQLAIGSTIQAKLREHTNFHPAQTDEKMILIATGTGIASYPGFLMEREQQTGAGETWLFFGNRAENLDYYYQHDWQKWLANGTLTKVSLAFSDESGQYIQDKMQEEAQNLYQWITEEQAHVYICGRSKTVGEGAMNALIAIYQEMAHSSRQEAEKWLENCQNNGQIHLDLFG